jgi:hypothetical protein
VEAFPDARTPMKVKAVCVVLIMLAEHRATVYLCAHFIVTFIPMFPRDASPVVFVSPATRSRAFHCSLV